jgi:hypothetical protein
MLASDRLRFVPCHYLSSIQFIAQDHQLHFTAVQSHVNIAIHKPLDFHFAS